MRALPPARAPRPSGWLRVRVAGLDFPNPIGMAAGFDKNAQVPDSLLRLGFGFVEIGTVTPLPQAGNRRPRIFRLIADRAVINRLGFNNEGHDAVLRRLMRRRGHAGIVGVNIGANKDSRRPHRRLRGRRARVLPASPPISPSTSPRPTRPACATCRAAPRWPICCRASSPRATRRRARTGTATPVFLKIAPDLAEAELAEIADGGRGKPSSTA